MKYILLALRALELQLSKFGAISPPLGIVPGTRQKLRTTLFFVGSWVGIPAGAKLHQIQQTVILKPFKLKEGILLFWKLSIFINFGPNWSRLYLCFEYQKSLPQDSQLCNSLFSRRKFSNAHDCICLIIMDVDNLMSSF